MKKKHIFIRKIWGVEIILIIAIVIMCIVALCSGHYSINPSQCIDIIFSRFFNINIEINQLDYNVIWGLRIPRIIAAILVGASLSIAGASYQSTFQNPLVSPDILGVSSGACVGAALMFLLHMPRHFVMVGAFVFAIVTVGLTLIIPRFLRAKSNVILVLSGIVVGGMADSIIGIIKYIADPQDELPQITYWMMGSLNNIEIEDIAVFILPIIICMLVLFLISWWIDIISMGDKDARTLGADVGKIRFIVVTCSTLLTAISVCICGTIGWVGLVIPHFARMFAGANNTRLLPVSALLGAVFMLFVDTIARTITSVEVPLGIITGLIGAPFYAWLLYKQRTRIN